MENKNNWVVLVSQRLQAPLTEWQLSDSAMKRMLWMSMQRLDKWCNWLVDVLGMSWHEFRRKQNIRWG